MASQGQIAFSGISASTERMLVAAENNLLTRPAMLDPVTKLRVSTPMSLIDTDFEYGPQHSKWETLETANNYGSFYRSESDADIPVVSINRSSTTDNPTNNIEVETLVPHGLQKGDGIFLSGTRSVTCDGIFVVHFVRDTYNFVFLAKEAQLTSPLHDSSTRLFPARLYQASTPTLSRITTNGLSPSTLTIVTDALSGADALSLGSEVAVIRSRGLKVIDFSPATDVQGSTNDAAGLKNYVRFTNHDLSRGERVVYRAAQGSSPVTNLTDGATYLVANMTHARIFLAPATNASTIVAIEPGAATGTHSLECTAVGSADGVYPVTARTNAFTFEVQLPFRVPLHTVTFNPFETLLQGSTARFHIADHGLSDQGTVTYSKGDAASAITGLTDGASYSITFNDIDRFQLNGVSNLTATQGAHTFSSSCISGRVVVSRSAIISEGTQLVKSTDSNFLSTFRKFDPLRIEESKHTVHYPSVSVTGIDADVLTLGAPHTWSTGMLVRYEHRVPDALKKARTITVFNVGNPGNIEYQRNASPDFAELFNKYGVGTFWPFEYQGVQYRMRFNSAFNSVIRNTSFVRLNGSAATSADIPERQRIVIYELLDGYKEPVPELTQRGLYYARAVTAESISLHTTRTDAVNSTGAIAVTSGPRSLGGGAFWQDDMYVVSASVSADSTFLTPKNFVVSTSVGANWSALATNVYLVQYLLAPGEVAMTGFVDRNLYFLKHLSAAGKFSLHATLADAVADANKLFYPTPSGYLRGPVARDVVNTTIQELHTATTLTAASVTPFSASAGELVVGTAVVPASKGLVLHRPFDGGVELIPPPFPGGVITRQTRRYFRYQSGKGIQMSAGVNFSGAFDIDTFTPAGVVVTRTPHRLTPGTSITVSGATNAETGYNAAHTVLAVTDERTFTVAPPGAGVDARGFVKYIVNGWTGAAVRIGMFDDQNGLFFEYDGQQLYAVRRNSIQQLPGTANVTRGSARVIRATGSTAYASNVTVGASVAIRGMTYRVASIVNDNEFRVHPPYRGATATLVIMSLVQDLRAPQSQWSVDRCDGTGPSGYNLNINCMQMAYIDYSWYGAGKARFGFKDSNGAVMYAHEFVHNNALDTAYMRSGNLPARYEVVNSGGLAAPTYVPRMMHWGTSVIMDGAMDNDRSYFFTINGKTIMYGGGDLYDFNASYNYSTTTTKLDPDTGASTAAYTLVVLDYNLVKNLRAGTLIVNASVLAEGTRLLGMQRTGSNGALLYINKRPLVEPQPNVVIAFGAGNPDESIPTRIPLVSLRLAPSVDNGFAADEIGGRDVVNRMQLIPLAVEILTTHDVEITLLLNGFPAYKTWARGNSPSIAQILYHTQDDIVSGGTPVFSFRAAGNAADSTGKRVARSTSYDLANLSPLGNSLLGGDDVFPNGPDILSVVASLIDTSGITSISPFTVSARLSWNESQA
jgi:hypothetical protein